MHALDLHTVARAGAGGPITRLAAAAALSLLPLLPVAPAHAAVQFTVTNLGTLGGVSSEAFAINASGQVAGRAYLASGVAHATRWTNGVAQDLGTLGGQFSNAYGINDAGQVAGDSYLADNVQYRGVLWAPNGTPQTIASPGSIGVSTYALNSSGVAVGGYSPTGAVSYAGVWRDGQFRSLPTASGAATQGGANGINDSGVIVGFQLSRPVVWANEGALPQQLPLLGGSAGTALAVNAAGTIVGQSETTLNSAHAVVWKAGSVIDLGAFSGGTSVARGINAQGQVVGSSVAGSTSRGFLWGAGTMVDLNDMLVAGSGATVTVARGINAYGQIAGTATFAGQNRAVLLTPTGSVAWQAGGNGSFGDATRWEQNFIPTKFIDAAVNSAGLQTITVNADAGVKSLALGLPAGSASRPTLLLQGGSVLQVAGLFTVDDTGTLAGDGTVAGNLLNRGSMLPSNLTVTGSFTNQGLVAGSGTLNAALANSTTGQVRSVAVETLHLIGPAHINAGTIDISGGGQQHYSGALANAPSGRILLNNAVLRLDGGVANAGQVQVSFGGATVYGSVATSAGGKVILSGQSDSTFFDAMVVDAGGELRVSNGSTGVFFGLVTQRTGALFTGTGTKFYEGGLSIGNSPGLGTDEGSVSFGVASRYTAEIGGTSACTAACAGNAALSDHSFDKLAVAGRLAFGGELKLVSWAGFTGQIGQSFDLFDWGSTTGSFSSIDSSGLSLANGAVLDISQLYSTGVVSITAVPEPGTWALLLGGLGLVLLRQRRRCVPALATTVALVCSVGSVTAAPGLDVYAISAGGQSAFGSLGPFSCATFAPDPRADRYNPSYRVSLPTDGPLCGVASDVHSQVGTSAPLATAAAVNASFGQATDPRTFTGSAAARAAYGDIGVRSAASYSGTSDSSVVSGSAAGALQTEAFTFGGASGSGTFRPIFTLDGALFTQGRTDNQIVFSYSVGNGPMFTTFRLQDSRGDFSIYAPGGYVASYPGITVSGNNTVGRLVSGSASFQIDVPITFGSAVELNFALWAGTLPSSSFGQTFASNGSADFYSSVRMTGIQVFDSSGHAVPGFSVVAGSGTLYSAAGVVPEPGTGALLLGGLGVVVLRLRRAQLVRPDR